MRRQARKENARQRRPIAPGEVAAALTARRPTGQLDSVRLAEAYARSVDDARYWQAPEGLETHLKEPASQQALVPVARSVVESPWATTWSQPCAGPLWQVNFKFDTVALDELDQDIPDDPASVLERWRAEVVQQEQIAEPDVSGAWWSTPPRDLGVTTGEWPGFGPAGLFLVEDFQGWHRANVAQAQPPASATVYEICDVDDWVRLCRDYPLDVSGQRHHDWGLATGRYGPWVMPDWQAVAADWDGVHLTYGGYLSGAARALEVGDGVASVIAGWDPDATYWFTAPMLSETSQRWRRTDAFGWRVVA